MNNDSLNVFLFSASSAILGLSGCQSVSHDANDQWQVQTQQQWQQAIQEATHISIEDGQAKSTEAISVFSSAVQSYAIKRKAQSITFKQTTAWDNWQEIPKVGLPGMEDAPVFIPVKDGDYWLLAKYWPLELGPQKIGKQRVKDPRPPTEQGYHAFHSTDMKTWVHQGAVSGHRERWVTTAEYLDGDFYIYYDNPNDEDPHLIVDSDLSDGKMGKDYGMVFEDPSHGSDCSIFRDDVDGQFHLIYENWDPINARTHAWDSPLAGHAISPDGINDFKILAPAVDHRTTPTGKMGEYVHGTTKDTYAYEIHHPEQNAYGDWTTIKVGGQYYLFCDYDPVGEQIRVGRFTSSSLDQEFQFVGEIGRGHPDPTVGFAEGEFYLIRQRAETDFKSSGPWIGGVEARVGVDTNGDGRINTWTSWQGVTERYAQKDGYVRIVETTPASLALNELPAGYGFAFEYRTQAVDGQVVNVVMESVELSF